MSQSNNIPLGIGLMIATTFVFAVQDGLSRHLAGEYNVLMVVMIRYWFFAAFVVAIARRNAGGIRAAAQTQQPVLQAFRGVLLAAEICVMVAAFTVLVWSKALPCSPAIRCWLLPCRGRCLAKAWAGGGGWPLARALSG